MQMKLDQSLRLCRFITIIVGFGIFSLILSGCGGSASATTAAQVDEQALANEPARSDKATQASEPIPPLGPPRLSKPLPAGVMPDRLEIPAIDLDTPVVELGWSTTEDAAGEIFSEWEVADQAAGWHKNSALMGEVGNIVLSGHNNIRGAVFRELDRLKKGDEAILWAGDSSVRYRVEQVMIVPEKHASPEQRAQNVAWIAPFADDRLTLVSCWPRNDNTHRIIVVARPLESTAQR